MNSDDEDDLSLEFYVIIGLNRFGIAERIVESSIEMDPVREGPGFYCAPDFIPHKGSWYRKKFDVQITNEGAYYHHFVQYERLEGLPEKIAELLEESREALPLPK